jgi:hypothetical protein
VGVALGASYEWNALIGAPQRSLVRSIDPRPSRTTPVATRGTNSPDVAADDAFLSDLELALERPHTRELVAFEAFTPHVREIQSR